MVYGYDARTQMRTVCRDSGPPVLVNDYDEQGNIRTQTLADGGKFEYRYVQDTTILEKKMVPNLILAPNGLQTYIQFSDGSYRQSLPIRPR